MKEKHVKRNRQNLLITLLFLGDIFFCYSGLTLGYLVRFKTRVSDFGLDIQTNFERYQPIIWLGTLFLSATFVFLKIYDSRLLLRPLRGSTLILRAFGFWFITFLGTSLVFKFEPAISRLFVAVSFLTTIATMLGWRYVFYFILSRSGLKPALTQKILIVGWNEDAARLAQSVETDANQPYSILGVVTTQAPARSLRLAGEHYLGTLDHLEPIASKAHPDVIVVADVDLTREQLLTVSAIAERHYARFAIIPSFFQIFVANLRMQSISGEPILSHGDPSLSMLGNRLLKRAIDLLGAVVGLIGSAPIILVLAAIIRREDPGSVFFVQERIGQDGQPFGMIKIRSMRLGADKLDHVNQSTLREDPRVLKIGKFIRRWNLDEVPQFWNVFRGDMSLVGPRPERTYHAQRLASEIPNYASRHLVKPGLTGWAQVNGLRGDTDLVQRVKYDLYYIENWSVIFDMQIMLLTFLRRKNAY
jgi:exopolysaccharide biosynthesis polyprenyl glycosylphosphotransferase